MAVKKTTEVAPVTETTTAVAELLPDDIQFEDDGTEVLEVRPIFPTVKLVQGTTRGVADNTSGMFHHDDSNLYEETLDVIPLHLKEQRALFEKDADQPGCMSLDNIAPLPDQPLWSKAKVALRSGIVNMAAYPSQPRLCVDCPFSKFGEDGSAPECGETILMIVKRDDDSFAQFRIGRTGLKPVRQQLGRMKGRARRLPIFAYRWSFGSRTEERGTKKWKQLTVDTRELTPSDIVSMNNLVRTMRPQVQEEVAKAAFDNDATIIDLEVPDYGDD